MKFPSEQFIEEFKNIYGALSVCESVAIYNIALEAPEGLYLELGSHKGKSGMSAALGLKLGAFVLVDPIFEDVVISVDVRKLIERISNDRVIAIPIADYSTNVIENYEHLSYVFVDSGSHQGGLPMQEVKMLEDLIKPGGIICFHDYKSQFIEVHEAYDYLVSTGKYEEIKIDWDSIIDYVRKNNLEQGNKSWHHNETEFPCFVGALKRK